MSDESMLDKLFRLVTQIELDLDPNRYCTKCATINPPTAHQLIKNEETGGWHCPNCGPEGTPHDPIG